MHWVCVSNRIKFFDLRHADDLEGSSACLMNPTIFLDKGSVKEGHRNIASFRDLKILDKILRKM